MRVFSLCAALVAITIVPAWAHEASRGGVTVAHPWARATPAGASVGAAYLEIKAADGVVDRLIGASSEVAGRTEIHTHIEEAGVMKMRRVDGIAVKSGGSHLLMPRGDHVMLMDLKATLKEGELIKLRLVFEKAGPIDVEATVEPVGAMGPHGMDHQPGHEMPATGKAGKPSHHHGH